MKRGHIGVIFLTPVSRKEARRFAGAHVVFLYALIVVSSAVLIPGLAFGTPQSSIIRLGTSDIIDLLPEVAQRVFVGDQATDLIIELQPLKKNLIIRGSSDPDALFELMNRQIFSDSFCRDIAKEKDGISLACDKTRIHAQIRREELQVIVLEGLPFLGGPLEAPPLVPLLEGDGDLSLCPGNNELSRGECAFLSGDLSEAVEQFQDAIHGRGSNLAKLRLGDIAAQQGDIAGALRWWQRVSNLSREWPLVELRLAEYFGYFEDGSDLGAYYNTDGLSELYGRDVDIRAIRASVFLGRPEQAISRLAGRIEREGDNRGMRLCRNHIELCSQLCIDALETFPDAALADAFVACLSVPNRFASSSALEVGRAVAARAEGLGVTDVPAFLLSSLTHLVSPADLSQHLWQVAFLFHQAELDASRDVIIEYARFHLGREAMQEEPWNSFLDAVFAGTMRGMPGLPEFEEVVHDVDIKTLEEDTQRAISDTDDILTLIRARRLQE